LQPQTKTLLAKVLKNKHFKLAVDLGVGEGFYSDVLKKHVDVLIGVDHDLARLSVAKKTMGYDIVVLEEAQKYEIPINTDAVFAFDFIEHLKEEEGRGLLQKITWVPYTLLTTPTRMGIGPITGIRNHHQSLWTEQKLQSLGFTTITYDVFPFSLIYGKEIMAIRQKLP